MRPYLSPDRLWVESEVDRVCSEWLEAPRVFPPRRRAVYEYRNITEKISHGPTLFSLIFAGTNFRDVEKTRNFVKIKTMLFCIDQHAKSLLSSKSSPGV